MSRIEEIYGEFLRYSFAILNPFKKVVIKTQCEVHKFINVQAITILKNDDYKGAYDFYSNTISLINEGAVWADQDFKSSTHMYNPYTKKGLYGRKNAMEIAVEYYNKASILWLEGQDSNSLFYLGAALHILQDLTIPQHANVRLLDNHKQYEDFVRKTYQYIEKFVANSGAYVLDGIYEYIRFNARVALNAHKRFKDIKEDDERYYRISSCILPLAERTTAGCMITFYNNTIKKRWS